MRRVYQLLVFIIFYGVLSLAQAEQVNDLNVGVVPVDSRSQAALIKVAPEALQQVLVKMSGNPSVSVIPEVHLAMTQQAASLVQSFSYTREGSGSSQLIAHIHFDKRAVEKLLEQASQAIWRANRPVTLAWVNLDRNDNTVNTIISSDDQTPVAYALTNDANNVGLPLILPAMDLQDQGYTNTSSNMPFDMSNLLAVGKRYHASSVLAGNLTVAVDGSWEGQWMYLLNGTAHQWDSAGATPEDVIRQAVSNMDSIMSSVMAVRDNPKLQSTVGLQIEGVTNLRDYALMLSDLRALNVIARIAVAQLNGATMVLRLKVVGGEKALQAALIHSTDLMQVPQPLLQSNQAQGLYYQFKSNNGVTS